jgi:hypothetical protein
VSSAMESVLGRLLGNTTRTNVVNELVAEFQKVDMHRLKLERPTTRICDLLLRPPPGWAWLADRLDEAAAQLKVEQATRREVEAELEDLRSSVARVWDLVLDDVGGSSLIAASMSTITEQLEGRLTPWPLTGSVGDPALRWLLWCRTSQRWTPT